MHILLTNDDGFQAKGLAALHRALAPHHKITVVAPETEQSAIGHAITVNEPIRVRPLTYENSSYQGFAVRGTPADCVKLGVFELLSEPPDLVVSGINHGANVGVNILYSGTVSAASDAAILGIPAIAFSQEYWGQDGFSFSAAAAFAQKLVEIYPTLEMPPAVLLNVNVPYLPPNLIKGVRLARQSDARLAERFDRRVDPRGRVYYWQAGESMNTRGDKEADFQALSEGYITITPVRHDMTHHGELERLRAQKGLLPEFP